MTGVPGAAALKVQSFHRLGELDAALRCGTLALESRPHDTALLGALSMVAIDLRMPDQAFEWAASAENTSEGLSSLGTLALEQNRLDDAMGYFDRGLAVRPDSPGGIISNANVPPEHQVNVYKGWVDGTATPY